MKLLLQRAALLLLIIGSLSPAVAQKKTYFDYRWKKAKAKTAYYYRIITPEGNMFLVRDYFVSNDQLQMEGRFRSKKAEDDTREGLFTSYYVNGQKSSEGEYKGGKEDGKWTFWFKNGQVKREGSYDRGSREGEWSFYHRNGQLEGKATYKSGDIYGNYIQYYDNGEKELVINYANGKKNGEFMRYYLGGKLKRKGNYVKDSLDGMYEEYLESGTLSWKGEYSDNKENGTFEFFHKNGNKSADVEYKNGKFLKATYYDVEGKKLSKKVYEDDLYKAAEYTGGREELYKLVNEKLGNKLGGDGIAAAKKNKYYFYGVVALTIDDEGNVVKREWENPDPDNDYFDDMYGMKKYIDAALDEAEKFQPCKSYNRNCESTYYFVYEIDFAKL